MSHQVTAATLNPKARAGTRNKTPANAGVPNRRRTRSAALVKWLLLFVLFPQSTFGYPFYLSWNDTNEDDDGTIVYRTVAGEYQEVAILGPRVTEFTDDPPAATGDSFCWTVRAFREGLLSEPSNETCATVPTTTEPSPTKPGKRRGQLR